MNWIVYFIGSLIGIIGFVALVLWLSNEWIKAKWPS